MNVTIRITLFSLFLLYWFPTTGQEQVGVYIGPEYKADPIRSYITDLIPGKNGSYYTIKEEPVPGLFSTNASEIYLEEYNEKLQLISTNKIHLPEIYGKKPTLEKVIKIKNDFRFFVSALNEKNKEIEVYGGFLNHQNFTVERLIHINSIERPSTFHTGLFNIIPSGDSTRFLVSSHPKGRRYQNEKFKISLIDSNFNNIYSKEIDLDVLDSDFTIGEILLDSSCNAHLLTRITVGRPGLFKPDPENHYELITYFHETDELVKVPVEPNGYNVTEIKMISGPEGDILLSGFYSEGSEYEMKGYFIAELQNKGLNYRAVTDFPEEFLTRFIKERKVNKGAVLDHYKLKKMISREDGGLVMVAEYENRVSHSYMTAGGYLRTSYAYYFNDIILINTNAKGETDWYARVPKKQVVNDIVHYELDTFADDNLRTFYSNHGPVVIAHLGFGCMVSGDKIYFIFNDHKRNSDDNQDPDKMKYMSNSRRAVSVMVIVDMKGNITRKKLFPAKTNKSIFMPAVNRQVDSNSLILFGERGRNYRFYKVEATL